MAAASTGSILSACGRGESGGGQGTDAGPLTWLFPGGDEPASRKFLSGQIQRFNKQHPDIKVEITAVPWDLAHDRIVQLAQTGDLPDLVTTGSRWIPEFAQLGILSPLGDDFGDDKLSMYFPTLLETVRYQGKLYALPDAYSTQALIYRTDLLDEPPGSWDELVAAAEDIQKANKGMNGFGYGAADNPGSVSQFFTVAYTFGARAYDAQGNIALGSPQTVDALALLTDMHRKHEIVPNPVEADRNQLSDVFSAERVAMYITGPWAEGQIGAEPDNKRVPYASAPLPAGPAGTATELVSDSTFIAADSDSREQALTFLDFITSEEEQVRRDLARGLVPQGPQMAKRPEFQDDPYFRTFIDMAENGVPQPQPPRYEPFEDIIIKMMQSAVLGAETPQQAVDNAVRALEGL